MSILSAKVAIVQIGSKIQVEGLLLEDGRFAIAQQQVAALFQLIPTSAPKWLNRLLGEDSSLFLVWVKTNRDQVEDKRVRSREKALLLEGLSKVIRKLDKEGNAIAETLVDALFGLSLEQLFADAFGQERSANDRQNILDRILDTPNPWERLYTKEACTRAFAWFGTDFYWKWCYNFLTPSEKCKLNQVNPPIKGDRLHRIHQHLEPETRTRLEPKVTRLLDFLMSSTSPQDFQTRIARVEGFDQTELIG